MTELKPCPFCGSPAELVKSGSGWYVECTSRNPAVCRCYPWTGYFDIPLYAIEAWNRRADHG